MFEFTKRSRKVLEILSQMESKRLNSDAVGPEHIFLSLLKEDDSVAARILKNLGINFEKLSDEIERLSRQISSSMILGRVPISSGYKRVVEMAREEARKLKNSYIGTEHLLLAIFREGSCPGIDSLINSGIDYNMIKSEILRVLGVKVGADASAKPKQQKSALEEFAVDLTQLARMNLLDPVIGRTEEISRTVRILSRKRKNNPILIGEAGVGKTAIVEGLAQLIVKKEVPESIQKARVLSLDMAALVAGTKYRGEFEERLKKVVAEIKQDKNIIVFIDEIHVIIGAGAAEGAIDAANILKPALARGELQCIGATTINEYRMHIEKDSALVRRFQSIVVDEPDVEETIQILKGLKTSYESHHLVVYTDEAIERAVLLSDRYISDRHLPDKAIDVLDEAGAMARLDKIERPDDIVGMEDELESLKAEKNELVLSQEYEKAAAVRDLILSKKEILNSKLNSWMDKKNEYTIVVDTDMIAAVVSENTGIPVESLRESESEKLLRMEDELHERVIGQKDAVSAVSRAIRRSRTGLSSPERPLGSFIFLGPTGVGKTELAKALAEYLFDDEKSLVRIDMSEYMEKHTVSRLLGAPPGYVGYEDGGQLTEKIRRRPYSVVLLDEIEKAHPDVFNILLQVLEEGELTDSSGNTVSFRDTILIMTSNAGSRDTAKGGRLGFGESDISDFEKERANDEMKRIFNPEFLNRIDEIVIFHRLGAEHIRAILDRMLDDINERLEEKGIELVFSDSIKNHLIEKGYDIRSGARKMRRIIQRDIEDMFAYEILKKNSKISGKVNVFYKNDTVVFKAKKDKNVSDFKEENAEKDTVTSGSAKS